MPQVGKAVLDPKVSCSPSLRKFLSERKPTVTTLSGVPK